MESIAERFGHAATVRKGIMGYYAVLAALAKRGLWGCSASAQFESPSACIYLSAVEVCQMIHE